MFPRSKRLSRVQIPLILQHGKRISSKNFTVVSSKSEQGYTVIISKKNARLSVTRHLLKRRIYKVLQATEQLPPSLIVFVRTPVTTLPYQAIKEELTTLLSKI